MGNSFMPVSLLAGDQNCLVVGGGNIALRKIDTLLNFGAKVTVVAPEIEEKIQFYADRGRLTVEKRIYQSPEAEKYAMVISASDDSEVNSQVHSDCKEKGVLLNVVDKPAMCNFIFPAFLTRDCLTIAVSSDGRAPFLSSHLKLILESIFGDHWNKIGKLGASFRKMVQERWGNDMTKKAACYEKFLEADWKEMIKKKSAQELDDALAAMLDV